MRRFPCFHVLTLAVVVLLPAAFLAVDTNFHNAPDAVKALKDPVEGQPQTMEAGRRLYARNCLSCHGKNGQGSGNVPSLADAKLNSVPAGEVFWFITNGSKENGMPSWAFLPEQQRWQIVTFVRSPELMKAAANRHPPAPGVTASGLKAPPPQPPFADFRYEKP
jgi:mono/diheme cytochrome c family protein